MSHIGCGNNITQPTGQCFGCKYWKPARKTLFLSTSGHCTLSYCKKNSIYNKRGVKIFFGEYYVLSGQLSNGQYLRAYGDKKTNYPAKKCRIIRHNEGLVFVA